MRDFVNIIPGLYVWLLGHACHCCEQWRETVSILSQTLERLADAPKLLGWASAEAVLHTLSSIAKVLPKQYSVENAETNSQLVSMLTVLVKLLIDQSCAMCRPIARIGSVLLPEAIGIIISHGRSMEKSVVDVLVYESLLSLMYFSVYHSEVVVDPIERAAALRLELSTCKVSIDNIQITLALQLWHLPFRVKQDHIGAVSLSRLLQFLLVNEYVFLTDGASEAVSSVSVTSTSSMHLRNMNTSDYSSVTLSKLALLKVLQFNQLEYRNSINNGRGKYQSIATMLLLFCNYYNFLDRHQPRRLPLSVESFRLIFHSMGLATFLLDRCYSSVYPIDSQLWSCDTLVEVVGINLSSIFVKLCSTNLVDGAQSEKLLRNFFSKALVNAVPNALLESVQYISLAWTEAPVSSTQLISMLNELLINYASYVKLSSAANQLLVVVDGLLPAIEILINLQLTFSSGTELVVISTDDSPPEIAIQLLLGTVIACNKTLITIFCSTVESNSLSNSQHEVINRIVLQSYSIIGNVAQLCLANSNNIEPIIRTGSTVVEAARAVMR